MVVIFLSTASETVTPQERVATPSRCTVQEPHCAMPQPYLVPVSPAFSRIAHSSGVSGSTSSSKVFPFIVRFAIADPLFVQLASRTRGIVYRILESFNSRNRVFRAGNNLVAAVFRGPQSRQQTNNRSGGILDALRWRHGETQEAHHAAQHRKAGAERQRHG